MNIPLQIPVYESYVTELRRKISNTIDIRFNYTNEAGFSLLHIACITGMTDICKLLLKNGVYLNMVDYYGRTPLMIACGAGFLGIAEFLINSGADPNICDAFGFNALLMAVISGEGEMVAYLLEQTTFNTGSLYLGNLTALALASSLGRTEIIGTILRHSSNIDAQTDFSGVTPLMLAVCGGHSSTVKLLLEKNSNLNIKSEGLFKASEYASFLRQLDIITLFNMKTPGLISPGKRTLGHPLTPNLCLSPVYKSSSPKKCITWIKKSLKVRSRSLDSRKAKYKKMEEKHENAMEYILISSNLSQYWPVFKEQEITFKTFLSMNDEDLSSIGIKKESVRNKMINLIHHYNKIFSL